MEAEQPTLTGITPWMQNMQKLRTAYASARGRKSPQSAPGEATEAHVHEWRKYKETIRPDRRERRIIGVGSVYYDDRHKDMYFVVRACECKEKRYVDLILR